MIALGVGAAVFGALKSPDDAAGQKAITPAAPPPARMEAAPLTMPDDQRRFVEEVDKARTLYRSGANDMAKGAARPARAKALCAMLRTVTISGWVGRVGQMSSNGDGLGVLGVTIGNDIWVKTWNNSFSDTGERTLLQPGTEIFERAVALHKGSAVTFSGRFFSNATDCVHETSMSLAGSLTAPEFVFRFTDIREF